MDNRDLNSMLEKIYMSYHGYLCTWLDDKRILRMQASNIPNNHVGISISIDASNVFEKSNDLFPFTSKIILSSKPVP